MKISYKKFSNKFAANAFASKKQSEGCLARSEKTGDNEYTVNYTKPKKAVFKM